MTNYTHIRRLSPINLNQLIEHTDIPLLEEFLTKQGKILPRHLTQLTVKQQRKIKTAIKKARIHKFRLFGKKEAKKDF